MKLYLRYTVIGMLINLIMVLLLMEQYPDMEEFANMSLFAISLYTVPMVLMEVVYVLVATTSLLALGYGDSGVESASSSSVSGGRNPKEILMGLWLTQLSPVAGRLAGGSRGAA